MVSFEDAGRISQKMEYARDQVLLALNELCMAERVMGDESGVLGDWNRDMQGSLHMVERGLNSECEWWAEEYRYNRESELSAREKSGVLSFERIAKMNGWTVYKVTGVPGVDNVIVHYRQLSDQTLVTPIHPVTDECLFVVGGEVSHYEVMSRYADEQFAQLYKNRG